jgi:hypothetical protein
MTARKRPKTPSTSTKPTAQHLTDLALQALKNAETYKAVAARQSAINAARQSAGNYGSIIATGKSSVVINQAMTQTPLRIDHASDRPRTHIYRWAVTLIVAALVYHALRSWGYDPEAFTAFYRNLTA